VCLGPLQHSKLEGPHWAAHIWKRLGDWHRPVVAADRARPDMQRSAARGTRSRFWTAPDPRRKFHAWRAGARRAICGKRGRTSF